MNDRIVNPAPLALKPDLEDANHRWQAFFAGEMIDRPIVCVTAPRDGMEEVEPVTYHDRVFGDLDDVIDRSLRTLEGYFFGGEAVPELCLSFGPDEVAVFCGGQFGWSDDSGNTNWSEPFVNDWEQTLPIGLQEDNPLWLRMLEFYRRAADKAAGKALLQPLDLHTNMDLLMSMRGSQNLCMDLVDQPELIDRAMADARKVFPRVWRGISEAGRMDEIGYAHHIYSMEGAAFLQCDFSCMISPEMFRRWVIPALEEEAAIVKHAAYHWDGPDALRHMKDLCATKGLHSMAYVPGTGHGGHINHLDVLKEVQSLGKAVHAHGTIDEIKTMHRELDPAKVCYGIRAASEAEAEELLEWLVKNT